MHARLREMLLIVGPLFNDDSDRNPLTRLVPIYNTWGKEAVNSKIYLNISENIEATRGQ